MAKSLGDGASHRAYRGKCNLHCCAECGGCARAIDDCIRQVDSVTANGFELIATQCPDLLRRMQSSDWAAWLPQGWQNDYNNLTARTLAALRMDVARELALRAGARSPQVALVRPILADLAPAIPRRVDGGSGCAAGYGRCSHRSPRAARTGMTVSAAASISPKRCSSLWRTPLSRSLSSSARTSLSMSGALPPAASPYRESQRGGAGAAAGHPAIELARCRARGANERRECYSSSLQRGFTAARRLPGSRALTVRELTRAAEFTDAADRERLEELALTSERLRFAPAVPMPAGVARVLDRGRELFDRLGEALAGAPNMRDRLVTLACALGALALFILLFVGRAKDLVGAGTFRARRPRKPVAMATRGVDVALGVASGFRVAARALSMRWSLGTILRLRAMF